MTGAEQTQGPEPGEGGGSHQRSVDARTHTQAYLDRSPRALVTDRL